MFLSDLEIFGFKSFYKKTNIKFANGITAIVGPNGCGKSNIVDAIRWVLGEQKTSVLRSDSMANVIFNGTSSRQSLSMAEVKMTIQNTKNILPSEYSDITIARRIMRNGESHFFLNNTRCRLKDIHDLFMDTGMGADSYSVIESKMVEAILNGKPEERRHLIEEAAGITKYKERRKEASRNLLKVLDDLSRANDILIEIQKNVNSLSRQAAKTRRYNSLIQELREVELKVIFLEYNTTQKLIETKKTEVNNLLKNIEKSQLELGKTEEQLSISKANAAKVAEQLETKRQEFKEVDVEFNIKTRELAVSKEKIQSLDYQKERIQREIEESTTKRDELQLELESLEVRFEELVKKNSNSKYSLEEKQEQVNIARNNHERKRDELQQVKQKLNSQQDKISSLKNIIARNEIKLNVAFEAITNENKKIKEAESEIIQIQEKIAGLAQEQQSFNFDLAGAEKRLSQAVEEKKSIENSLYDLRQKVASTKNEISSKQSALSFLNNIREGNANAKMLLDNKEWSSVKPEILLELVGVDDDYRIAIESLLGEFGHTIICNSKEDLEKATILLQNNDRGKSNFIIRSEIPPIKKEKDLKDNKIIAFASELVRVDDEIRNYLRGLFSNTVIVKDKEAALEVLTSNSNLKMAVSLKGEIYSNLGYAKVGSVTKNEGIQVGKIERINLINTEINELDTKLEGLVNQIEEQEFQLAEIDINKLVAEVKEAELQIKQNEQKNSQFEIKYSSLEQAIENYKKNIETKNSDVVSIEEENKSYFFDIASSEEEITTLNKQMQDLTNEISELSDLFEKEMTAFRYEEIEYTKLSSEMQQSEREIKRISSTLDGESGRNEKRHNELISSAAIRDGIEKKIIDFTAEIDLLSERIKTYNEEILVTEIELKNQQSEIETISTDLNNKRKSMESLKDAEHKFELEVTNLNSKIEQLISRTVENYEVELATLEIEINEDFNLIESKALISDLKNKLQALGGVNFEALEQYEEESQRLDLYEKQVSDLQAAEKNLNQTIEEINATAIRNFKETFEKIRNNYQTLFAKLFGGEGKADLILESDDVLEANIRIMAQPPGKKPASIESLSSGEKTLTAIALLFGIYMVKPSPFCILDEVDGPLDDANIDKYIGIIREFCKETQFLVVTHNKKTMSNADFLYGVTQPEKGLSTIASVRMN